MSLAHRHNLPPRGGHLRVVGAKDLALAFHRGDEAGGACSMERIFGFCYNLLRCTNSSVPEIHINPTTAPSGNVTHRESQIRNKEVVCDLSQWDSYRAIDMPHNVGLQIIFDLLKSNFDCSTPKNSLFTKTNFLGKLV